MEIACVVVIFKDENLFLRLVSGPSRGSSLCPTLSAVNWSTGVWFERHFAFLAAVGADCLVHLAWSSISIRHRICTSILRD